MEMKRREFLARSIAGMGGVLLGSGCMDAAQQKPAKYDPYELVPLGKTGIKVSRVGLGTGMRGGGRQSNHTDNEQDMVSPRWDTGKGTAEPEYCRGALFEGAKNRLRRPDFVSLCYIRPMAGRAG